MKITLMKVAVILTIVTFVYLFSFALYTDYLLDTIGIYTFVILFVLLFLLSTINSILFGGITFYLDRIRKWRKKNK